jgi:hypothetical protein
VPGWLDIPLGRSAGSVLAPRRRIAVTPEGWPPEGRAAEADPEAFRREVRPAWRACRSASSRVGPACRGPIALGSGEARRCRTQGGGRS